MRATLPDTSWAALARLARLAALSARSHSRVRRESFGIFLVIFVNYAARSHLAVFIVIFRLSGI